MYVSLVTVLCMFIVFTYSSL